ncbi:bifunctional polynucleotide phosphatase/kinase-like isoform X2 [Zophobas morio]|uniref:bifunctional polynucleotide phosphatase/kinase-like isoform X2 n=1 Tax=Zophobas morio TaxID=2755281 RepID=UPI003083AC21
MGSRKSALATKDKVIQKEVVKNKSKVPLKIDRIFKVINPSAFTADLFKVTWFKEETVLIGTCDESQRNKIAAFDLDHTLVTTKSGKAFSVNENDWKFTFPVVVEKLDFLYKNGYKIVVISNQLGITKKKVPEFFLKKKVAQILKAVGVPVQCFLATALDKYRKPLPGMWSLVQLYNKVNIDLSKSFFCGDAAGRPAGWEVGAKKDFSDSDRKFAFNVGLTFHTPEEFFLNAPPQPFQWKGPDPKLLPLSTSRAPPFVLEKDSCELLINVGSPGAGKTFFTENFLVPFGYRRINQDTLRSLQRCLDLCDRLLGNREKVVIDNTNAESSKRGLFLALARKHGVAARCLYFSTSRDLCRHNDIFRELTAGGRPRVGDIALNVYQRRFEMPTADEGFEAVIEVPFEVRFKADQVREYELYCKYLTA